MNTNARPLIVALGEVLWDIFPTGRHLGGAPANFAVHCAELGARSVLVSGVGHDDLGRQAVSALSEHGVDTRWVQVEERHPTGTVPVTLVDGQPSYEIVEGVAWDHILWQEDFEALAKTANAICFGSLAQRSPQSRETIQRFVDATTQQCLRVLDVNFRQHYHSSAVFLQSLALANVVKLNEDEVALLRLYVGGSMDRDVFLHELRARFNLDWVILTLGALGCCVFGENGVVSVPGTSQDVVNTVGAGDAFTAAFVCHYLKGEAVAMGAQYANALGGYVTTQESGTPHLPNDFCIWSNDANT
jgi:fructokinase